MGVKSDIKFLSKNLSNKNRILINKQKTLGRLKYYNLRISNHAITVKHLQISLKKKRKNQKVN